MASSVLGLLISTLAFSGLVLSYQYIEETYRNSIRYPLNKNELDSSKIQLFEDEFNKDLQFDSERLEQYFKTISDVVPPNTFVVLLGDSSDVINEISNTYFLRQISLSHTGEDHIHPPEMFFDEVLDIDISLNDNQKSIFILQKSKLALRPVKKLILN